MFIFFRWLFKNFFLPKTVLQLVLYSSFFFRNFMYLTLTDSKSNSSGAQRETVVQVKPLFEYRSSIYKISMSFTYSKKKIQRDIVAVKASSASLTFF